MSANILRIISFTSLYLIVFQLFNELEAQITDGLVLSYQFNNNLEDSSGNDNDATAFGGSFGADKEGVNAGAYHFDGEDDFLRLSGVSLNTNTLTLSAWVKFEGTQKIFTGIIYSRSSGIGWETQSSNQLAYAWDSNPATWNWTSGLAAPADTWVFIAMVLEPTKVTMYRVLDGELEKASRDLSHNAGAFGGDLRIGSNEFSDRFLKGAVDEVRVFSRALSSEEIQELSGEFTAMTEVVLSPPVVTEEPAAPETTTPASTPGGGTAETATSSAPSVPAVSSEQTGDESVRFLQAGAPPAALSGSGGGCFLYR